MSELTELEIRIKALKPGDHLCCIYESDEEHRTLLKSFLKEGLLRNEKIMYIVDVRSAEDILDYLRSVSVNVEPYVNKGQLNILSVDESYMSSGVFDPDGMISLLKEETKRALQEGYAALRVTGEMSWALRGLPGSDRLIEYENKLNDFFPGNKCLAICQYDRRRFEAKILLDVLTTHPIAIIGNQLYDNFYYIQPKDLLGSEPDRARLNNWLHNLQGRKREEETLQLAHHELESKVQERTKELTAAQHIAHLGSWRWNMIDNTVQWSPELYKLLDIDPRKVKPSKMTFLERVHPQDRSYVEGHIQSILSNHESFSIDHRILLPNGAVRYLHSVTRVDLDEQNRPVQLLGITHDITERKRAEEELKIKDAAIASSINAIGMTDAQGKMIYVNDSLVKMWGFDDPDEILGRYLPEFWEGDGVDQTLEELMEKGSRIGEDIGKRKDGSLFNVQYSAHMIKDQEGRPLYMFGSFIDITDTKHSEEQLRRSEYSLSEAQRIAHLGNWDWNIETNELNWSDEIFRIFALKSGEFGATYEAFLNSVHPADRNKVKKAVAKALDSPGNQYSLEHRIVRPDASERIVHEMGEVTFNKKKKPTRMIGTVQDITERKKLEGKLAQQLKEIQLLKQKLEHENIYLRKEIKLQKKHDTIIGKSSPILQVLNQIEQVAPTDSATLIEGETGTGKELIAHSIHDLSTRNKQVMVKVNCAAIPSPLLESELFGREKGAYTGALSRQIGRFELANKSTIFLDEVGELSLELQAKLLRVLQEGAFERLGSPKTITVDVRIIAASNRNLLEEIAKNRFREDLFYRLNVFPIVVPPLRDRKEDIPLLVWNFVNEFAEKMNKDIHHISQKSMETLQSYHWPGNIRELRNVIEHAVIISTNKELPIQLPTNTQISTNSWQTLEENEREYITRVLKKTNWRIKGKNGAAILLDLKPSTLYARMNRLGIPTQREKTLFRLMVNISSLRKALQ
jgi:formate hydrogenlyase transcriptional activator